MVKFEVLVDGSWVEADFASIQHTHLSYRLSDGRRGFASIGKWRLSESTISHPDFKRACWNALTADEQEAALARRSHNATKGLHRRPIHAA